MRKLLFYAIAFLAFVACKEDDLDSVISESLKGNAYISVAFNSNTNSSRAGDKDGTVDDSGHHNVGTDAENKVEEVLVIIAKCADGATTNTGNSYADLADVTTDGTTNGIVATLAVNGFEKNASGSYKLIVPYRMDYLGAYKVLIVLNPVDNLKTAIAGKNHKEAYQIVCDFKGEARTGQNADGNFMMANKSQVVVTATTEHNESTNPVIANVAVERVISKITFRYAEPNADFPESLKTKPNVYQVTTNVAGVVTAVTENFWYIADATVGELNYVYNYATVLNKAKDLSGNDYWVMIKPNFHVYPGGQLDPESVEAIFTSNIKQDKYTGIYLDSETETTKVVEDDLLTDDYNTAKARVTAEFVQGLTFSHDENSNITETTYYVELTHYALVNLSKTVYAVRHIGSRQFGILGDNEYLIDPQTVAKNAATADAYASFYNQDLPTVQNVIAAANYSTELPTPFRSLPSALESDAVTGVDAPHGEYNSIGAHMQYVYENAVNADKQVAGLVTGVVFAGKIYDAAGNPLPVMYKYKQQFYVTLRALLNANNGDTALANITENSTNEQAKAAGIDVYLNGRCYYYSAQIKHFEDNADDQLGVMEYAIMRNNIYSLRVSNIQDLGDAQLELTPNQSIVDIRAYIGLEVSILPWIVRFNDLEL